MQGDVKRVEGNCNSYYCYDIVQKINLPSFQICHDDKEIEKWLSKNLSSTALSGQVVMNSGGVWMPHNTKTMCWSCCSSNTSPTNTPGCPMLLLQCRKGPVLRTWSPSKTSLPLAMTLIRR